MPVADADVHGRTQTVESRLIRPRMRTIFNWDPDDRNPPCAGAGAPGLRRRCRGSLAQQVCGNGGGTAAPRRSRRANGARCRKGVAVHVALGTAPRSPAGYQKIDPAPLVELGWSVWSSRRSASSPVNWQEPDLLRRCRPGVRAAGGWHAAAAGVAQPAGVTPSTATCSGSRPVFPPFAVHGFQRRLVAVHPTLRELPAVAPHAPRPEHAPVGAA